MLLEDRGDRLAVPPEDELFDRTCWSNATRPEHGNALSAFAADAVVGDSVAVSLPQLDAQLLGCGVVGWRVDVGEFALASPQIVEVRALHRRLENFEIEILCGSAHRLEKRDTVVLHLRDRGRLVPRSVID